jgi:crotonobetainyl-CoA:carnitine CoA-transferase CaiB-like acyl-CoA transferase
MSALLEGFRVLESASLLNGDHLGMCLADLGADVIKVEAPGSGDYLRDILGQMAPHYSPAHVQLNKGKRSLALNLKTDRGLDIFWRLHATADVFIDGNVPGTCDRLGIGYESQRAVRPTIVYCQYTGFGASGPYSLIPTHGEMMNAAAASKPVRMGADGLVHPSEPPPGLFDASMGGAAPAAGAIYGAFHVAAALARRSISGVGYRIDVSASEAVVAHALMAAIYALNWDRIHDHKGLPARDRGRLTGAKYQYYQTADEKYVLFCAIEPKFWRQFCEAVGRPDLLVRHDASRAVDFGGDDDPLRRELQQIFSQRTQREWVALASDCDIPIGPAYNDLRDLPHDPQMAAREIFLEGEHPVAGPFTYVGQPVVVEDQPYRVSRPAPALGEHNDEILGELGITQQDQTELAQSGVTAAVRRSLRHDA